MKNYITAVFIFCFLRTAFLQFDVLDTPHAPDVSISYQQFPTTSFVFHLSNPQISNNYGEIYSALDNSIDSLADDRTWDFQGYLVFQLLNETISLQDPFIPEFFRLVKILDLSDTVSEVKLNWDSCYSEQIQLNNLGTNPDFQLTNDAFTEMPFLSGQTYCFLVYSFATNVNALDPQCNNSNYALIGRTNPNTGAQLPNCLLANSAEMNENEKIEMISISPNPGNGPILLTNYHSNCPAKISIYNELGKLVIDAFTLDSNCEIELPTTGVFTLHIKQNGSSFFRKVVRF